MRSCFAAVVLGVGVLAGCSDDPELIPVTIRQGDKDSSFLSQNAEDTGVSLPSATGLIIEPEGKIHWIEVLQCIPDDGPCVPQAYGPYRNFDAAWVVWETAMGENFDLSFDDAMRGPPMIEGPIVYGEMPEHARWQMPAVALEEGELYAVNVYRTESCDTQDDLCLSTQAAGGLFFTVENGQVKEVAPAVVEELD